MNTCPECGVSFTPLLKVDLLCPACQEVNNILDETEIRETLYQLAEQYFEEEY